MSTLLQRGRRGESLAEIGIIDIHGHLGRFFFCVPDLSPASVVAAMDRIGVKSVICSAMRTMGTHVDIGNREVLEAVGAFPGRILGYVSLSPADPKQASMEARRYFEEGFVGIKLHNSSGCSYTDPGFAPALAMANERRMILLLHTWGRADEFAEVRQLSASYPDIAIMLAHAGANGGQDAYVKIANECENVHLDLCMSAAPPGLVERLVAGAGVEKIVWGSDVLFINQAHQIGKVLGAHLSDDEKVTILSTNARRMLDRIQS